MSWLKELTLIIKWTKKRGKKLSGPFSESYRTKEVVQDSKALVGKARTKVHKIRVVNITKVVVKIRKTSQMKSRCYTVS